MTADRILHRISPGERAVVVDTIRQVLATDPDVVFAYLFGSFAEKNPFHDVDVGIFLDEARLRGSADQRAFDLAGRLEAALRFPVDVVALNARPVTFRFHVYSGELFLVNDETRFAEELERTTAEYFDIEPVLRHATREAFGK